MYTLSTQPHSLTQFASGVWTSPYPIKTSTAIVPLAKKWDTRTSKGISVHRTNGRQKLFTCPCACNATQFTQSRSNGSLLNANKKRCNIKGQVDSLYASTMLENILQEGETLKRDEPKIGNRFSRDFLWMKVDFFLVCLKPFLANWY